MTFLWVPRTQPDEAALQRLERHFPRPSEPPPHAWFMGETAYYTFITEDRVEDIPLHDLERYLHDTSHGLRIFATVESAQQRWRETFHYLLPHLIKRCTEDYLLSDLIGYFFIVYPDEISEPYPEYRLDILHTLGNAIMGQVFWDDNDLSESTVQHEWDTFLLHGSNDFINTLSSAIYFCLKYLTPSEIAIWTDSLTQIHGVYWHFQLMNWLFQETFPLLVRFDADDLPKFQTVRPENGFGIYTEVPELQLPTANVQTFLGKLKEHGLYRGLSTT